jgi:hypothetical protein
LDKLPTISRLAVVCLFTCPPQVNAEGLTARLKLAEARAEGLTKVLGAARGVLEEKDSALRSREGAHGEVAGKLAAALQALGDATARVG